MIVCLAQSIASKAAYALQRFSCGGLLCLLMLSIAQAANQTDVDSRLKKADALKSSNYSEFVRIISDIEASDSPRTKADTLYLRYLKGWEAAYVGEYSSALQILENILAEATDTALSFRARSTMINVLSISKDYERAFAQLNLLQDTLPTVVDADARGQGLRVAALLYNQVGQFDLALNYADSLAVIPGNQRDVCTAKELRLRIITARDIGKTERMAPEYESGIDSCRKAGELVFANLIASYVARIDIAKRNFDDAIKLLSNQYAEVQATKYPPVISEFESLLAQAYRETGNTTLAKQFASRAIENATGADYRESIVSAFRLLYLIAKEQGDSRSSLAFHEKYMAADKGYLNDVSARQLAYQRVKHEVDANKLQIETLNKQNEVLKLQRQLGDKAIENLRLYIVLSVMVLCFILLWAYKTKRSQMHFMKLSRQDGLTGIFNRPHFIDQSVRALNAAKKSGQVICVVICDLDYFKAINDTLGHATGDNVLKQTAAAFQSRLQKNDIVGRLGGEEFGLLFVGCDLAEARQRCEQLRSVLSEIVIDESVARSRLSASFGIATTTTSGHEFRQLLAHADSALYRAKRTGRDRVVLHDENHEHSVVEMGTQRLSA